jgi:hypothetical protein
MNEEHEPEPEPARPAQPHGANTARSIG